MLGLALCRHIVCLPPVVAMEEATIIQLVGSTIQWYLTADLRGLISAPRTGRQPDGDRPPRSSVGKRGTASGSRQKKRQLGTDKPTRAPRLQHGS
jgi:hypothetical protein